MVYWDETIQKIVYRASSLGYCDKALVAARLNHTPSPAPAKLQATFDAGHDAETWVNTQLHLTYQQDSVRLDIPGTDACVIGHIDGLEALPPPLLRVAEIKSQSPREYDRWTEDSWTRDPLWRKYAWQVSVYMHATGNARGDRAELALVRVRRPGPCDCDPDPGSSYIHKTDCNSDHRFTVRVYTKPFHTLPEIYARVQYLEELAANELLPACTANNAFGCPFFHLHEDDTEWLDDDEIDEACEDYAEARTDRDLADARVKVAKERLTKILGGPRKVQTRRYRVTYAEVEVKEHVVKASKQQRLTVKEVDGAATDQP